MRDDLVRADIPIGRILKKYNAETRREINVIQIKIGVLQSDDAAFGVKYFNTQSRADFNWLILIKNRCSTVPWSDRRIPISLISGELALVFLQMVGPDLDFLQAERVRLILLNPGKALLPKNRAVTIHIPGCNLHA